MLDMWHGWLQLLCLCLLRLRLRLQQNFPQRTLLLLLLLLQLLLPTAAASSSLCLDGATRRDAARDKKRVAGPGVASAAAFDSRAWAAASAVTS